MPHTLLTFGTALDLLAVMIILAFLIRGLMRGVSDETSRIAGFVGGVWVGYMLYPKIQSALQATGAPSPTTAIALTTLLLALLAAFVTGLVFRYLYNALLQVVVLQPADAVLGMAAGAAYAGVVIAIIFSFGMLTPYRPAQRIFSEQSRVGQIVCPWLRTHMRMI